MDHWRQLDIADPALFNDKVTIIGCGGIGSPTALALTKMGVSELEFWDDDVIEPHNLPNQMYRLQDINKHKVEALRDICKNYADIVISIKMTRLDTAPAGVVISSVDSMQSRKSVWEKIKYNPDVKRYIDGRMGGQLGMVLSVDPLNREDISRYEETLYSDEQAEPEACTNRSIIYNTFMLASLIAHAAKLALLDEEIPYRNIVFDFVTMNLIKLQ